MNDKSYPTDLTDEQWRLISAFFTKSERRGRERIFAGSLMGAFMFSAGVFPGG